MSNEEKILVQRFGKQTPFKVPEGYFESFEQSLMENLPQREAKVVEMPRSRLSRLRPWSYAAAVAAAVVVMGAAYLGLADHNDAALSAASPAKPANGYTVEQVADYAMVDNTEIYALLAGE